MATRPLSILCLASFFKGGLFMQALKAQGHHVLLLTQEKYVNEAWPRESIDELFAVPKISQKPDIFYTVSYLNRGRKIDAVVALDDFDVEIAGDLREHVRVPGLGSSLARHFRDKLAMRQVARAGEVFHVDSLVNDGKVIFATPSRYARPPLNVYQDGGVFVTRTMERKDKLTKALLSINQKTIKALGLPYGATHAEFLRANADGQLYFIECAARVGGANISDMVEQASGVNLWREWAHIEAAHALGEPYTLPPVRDDYAAVIMCLAQQQWPDTSAYTDPEVVWRAHKEQHAGLILTSPNAARVAELAESYAQRFAQDFLMVMPPKESVRQM